MDDDLVVAVEPPGSADARHCLGAYAAELDSRFDTGFDPDHSIPVTADELTEPNGLLMLARLRGEPVGCGGLKLHGDEPAEIKRLWVAASARGLGVARRLLDELEAQARQRGVRVLHLDTNKDLTEAISLYRSTGWVEVDRFNDEPYAHHWFEKHL